MAMAVAFRYFITVGASRVRLPMGVCQGDARQRFRRKLNKATVFLARYMHDGDGVKCSTQVPEEKQRHAKPNLGSSASTLFQSTIHTSTLRPCAKYVKRESPSGAEQQRHAFCASTSKQGRFSAHFRRICCYG